MPCEKIEYANRTSATQAAKAIGKRSKHYSMHTYCCKHCGHWHLTSYKKRR